MGRADEASAVLEFVRSLRGAEFDDALPRYYAVHELLITLLERGEWPENPTQFKTLLAPLVCSTANQQAVFHERFEAWARSQSRVGAPERLAETTAGQGAVVRKRRHRLGLTAGAPAAFLAVAAALFWHPAARQAGAPPPSQGVAGTAGSATAAIPAPAAEARPKIAPLRAWFLDHGQPVSFAAILINGREYQSGADGSARIEVPTGVPTRYLVTHNNYRPVLADYPGSGPLEVELESASGRAAAARPGWVLWLLVHARGVRATLTAFPFVAMLGWWMWIAMRRLGLQKWNAQPSPRVLKLAGRGGLGEVFPPGAVGELTREMRRRTERESKALAGAATASATAKAAGYFTPVYEEPRLAQEYLVLIERTGARDQHAQLAAELARLLQSRGAYLTPYYYTGDPRVCYEVRDQDRSKTLEELAAVHPGHVLWMIGNAQAMVDPISGKARKWVAKTAAWQRRLVFDCGGSERCQAALEAAGIRVAAMDLEEMRAAVDVTLEEGPRNPAAGSGAALPAALSGDLRRLFAREDLAPDEAAEIVTAARRYLGPQAYDCFCACAIYPQLSLNLTVALARELVEPGWQYAAVQRIAGLPWMRYGSMPEWLRKRLIRRLPEAKLAQARAALQAYLKSAREGRGSGGWLEFLRPRGRMRGGEGALSDFVFLGVLWGLKPDALSLPSPGILSRLLYRRGHAMFGMRPLAHVSVSALLAAGIWAGTGQAERRLTQPPHAAAAAEDPFLRRVREVAESQVGKTQSAGLWRSPFVDWVFDQSAQLLGVATPLISPSWGPEGMASSSRPGLGIAIEQFASISVDSFTVSARGGTVRNYPVPAKARYLDLRPSTEPKRRIAVYSTTPKVSYAEVQRLAAAVQKAVSGDLHRTWNVDAEVKAYAAEEQADGSWWRVAIQEDSGQLGMLAYHSQKDGVPFGVVGAGTAIAGGNSWTVSTSHTIFEMIVDPYGARLMRGLSLGAPAHEVWHLTEICNPVEKEKDARTIDGVQISDFVTPRWFYDRASIPGERYDNNGEVQGPRQITEGGYSAWLDPATLHVWLRTYLNGTANDADEGRYPVTSLAAAMGAEADRGTGIPIGATRVNAKDGLTYVWIAPGRFTMGCSPGDKQCFADERPVHEVIITKGFWIGQSEVTQQAYEHVMQRNPSQQKGPDLPVEDVSWKDAEGYCRAIGGRLPSEAEWEYAARAGDPRSRYGQLTDIATYADDFFGLSDVKQKVPNAWGLYDMLGNAEEWVADWYGKYTAAAIADPRGPSSGQYKVLRGGSWASKPAFVRVSKRRVEIAQPGSGYAGLRCAVDQF